jgi:polysaccharide biosynthesis protein PslE
MINEELIIADPEVPVLDGRPKGGIAHVLEVGFRHRKLSIIVLVVALTTAIVAALWLPSYQSSMKILVKHERLDPVVTPDSPTQVAVQPVTEEDVNSEVEVLTGNDVLRRTAIDAGMVGSEASSWMKFLDFGKSPEERLESAVRRLNKRLDVQYVKRSNIITATYRSRDPQLAARVMKSLAAAYLEKHLAVHRMPTGVAFFDKQVQDSQRKLQEAEASLSAFGQKDGVAPDQARQLVVQKLNDFQVELQQTRTALAEAIHRSADLSSQMTTTPQRRLTSEKRADNAELAEKLKGTLLDLELKRTTLLQKYKPDYEPVREVETQIAQTKSAIDQMQQAPVQEQVTDADPTHDWIRNELAKVQADTSSLRAREKGLLVSIATYEGMARNLDNKSLVMADLERQAKVEEQNYLLYTKKQEEARIADALDQQRVVNVSLAETPTAPVLPVHSALFYSTIVGGFILMIGAGVVYTADRIDPSVRSVWELENTLQLPVLADVPMHRELSA